MTDIQHQQQMSNAREGIDSRTIIKKRPSMFEPLKGKGWDELSERHKFEKLCNLRDDCIRKEIRVLSLLQLRPSFRGQVPSGEMKAAAREFGVGVRRLQKLVKEYLLYRQAYPDEPGAEFFMPLAVGRPEGQELTNQQEKVIIYALAERARHVRSALNRVRQIEVPLNILDIHRLVTEVLKTKSLPVPSYQTVYRYIQRFKQHNPALFYSIVNGEHAVEENLLVKRRNDVERPNQRWQSDACDPPLYVLCNGEPTPVSIIVIFDDYSKYIIGWDVVPKVKRDVRGQLRRTTFTTAHVCRKLFSTMRRTGVCCENWYTDNGSQYIGADPYIKRLNELWGKGIGINHSRPGKPWGRGKVENSIGMLRSLIQRIPGSYNKRDRMSIRRAREHADLYTLDELKAELGKHFDHINLQPRRSAPSRYDVWRSVISHPAPPIHIIATLDIMETAEELVNVDDWSIQFLGQSWEPKATGEKDKQIYRAWMDAVASPQLVTARAVRLDNGWCAEVCMQGIWIEIVTKDSQIADSSHLQGQNGSLALLRDERRQLISEARAEVLQLTDGIVPHLVSSDGTYDIPASPDRNTIPAAEQPTAVVNPITTSETESASETPAPERTREKNTSSRRAPRRQNNKAVAGGRSSAATPPTVTSSEEMPDLAAIFAEIAAQLDS